MARQSEQVKLLKLQLQAQKQANENALLRQLIASPLVQLVGTVAVTEILENQGILSGRWAGALEGGVMTMVGLQALKDYGVIGAGAVGLGITAGGALSDALSDSNPVTYSLKNALLQGLPNAIKRAGF